MANPPMRLYQSLYAAVYNSTGHHTSLSCTGFIGNKLDRSMIRLTPIQAGGSRAYIRP
ncbi:uncharacterized protein FFMR_12191 [Fusarium fujikuroi]|nr:uncharacterized protein FFMR_12191 [Fusarium fujikuroi]